MKYAIIGLGFIAVRHVEAIKENDGILTWICDADSGKLEGFVSKDNPKRTQNYKEIYDIDYVIICSPNHLHADMMRYFSAKGIKIIVEKPPVIKINDFTGLEDRDINVMLQLRYHPEMIRLKEFVKNNSQETSMTIRMKRGASYFDTWKGDKEKSGGILFNLGIHYLDALFYCFGEDYRLLSSDLKEDKVNLLMSFGTTPVKVKIEVIKEDEIPAREIVVGNERFDFSTSQNLHVLAYRDILAGGGIKLKDCRTLLYLLFLLCK